MDAMHRRKSLGAKKTADTTRASKKRSVADGREENLRPRDTHPEFVDSQKRIKGNLKQLNKRLVEHPVAVEDVEASAEIVESEDRGARVVTKKVASRAQIPFAYMLSLILVAGVLMYVLFLFVQVEEYSKSISEMESRIAELKEEATRLEVQLEGKYDLDEIERIATQEYGMVVSSTLPKKYISVSASEDVWQEVVNEDEKPGLFEQIITGIRTFMGKDKE